MEQLEAKKQKEQARAKLRVYQEIKEFTDELHSVEDDPLDTSPIPINLKTEAMSLHQPQERRHSATDRNIPNPTAQPANQPQDVLQFPVEGETTYPVTMVRRFQNFTHLCRLTRVSGNDQCYIQ